MSEFTPWSGLMGGVLIGLSASLLLIASGRVAGVSGILAGALFGDAGDRAWRVAFLIGLLAAGLVLVVLHPVAITPSPRPLLGLALAGLLVGFGTQLGNGCTSGHGVCGMSRLSRRSIAATLLFLASGMLTVAVMRVLGAAS